MIDPRHPVVGGVIVAGWVLAGLVAARVAFAVGEWRAAALSGRSRLVPLGGATPVADRARRRWAGLVETTGPVRRWAAHRAAAERAALLPEFVDAVSRALAGGASVTAALREGGDAIGAPFDADMARTAARCSSGLSLTDSLDRWAVEVGDEGAELFATACRLGVESGRGTAGALSGVAETLADRRDVKAEADALASQAKASAAMLTGLPVVVCLGMAVVDPTSIRSLLGTPLGLGCLLVGVGLDGIGAWWMRRMIRAVS